MKVFMSYARQDRDWALELARYLAEAGFEPWLDSLQLYPGDNWPLETGRALRESDAMVVLVSPAAAESEAVQQDVQYALGSEKFKSRLVPVVLEPTNEMPWILKRLPSVKGKPAEAAAQIASILKSPSASPQPQARAGSL